MDFLLHFYVALVLSMLLVPVMGFRLALFVLLILIIGKEGYDVLRGSPTMVHTASDIMYGLIGTAVGTVLASGTHRSRR